MTGVRRALVIGGIGPAVLSAGADLGIEIIHFQHPDRLDPAQQEIAADTYPVDLADGGATAVALATRIHQERPLGAVLSMTELGLEPAARIAAALGLRPASSVDTAGMLRDKARMRACLAASTDPAVRASAVRSGVAGDVDGAALVAREIGFPVIAKPRSGTASLAIRKIERPDEVKEAVAEVLSVSPDGAVIEEFLDGPECSVEAFSFAGTHRVVAVTGKHTGAGFIELGHVVPAPLDPDERDAIHEAVARFLTAVGVTDGPSHTEVIRTAAGPRVVESHDRLGGDRIFRLVQLATGVDLAAWCFAWPFGLMDVPDVPVARRAAAVRFLTARPGTVTCVTGADEVRALPYVDECNVAVAVGARIGDLRDSWGRVGHVVVTAADPSSATDCAARVAALVEVATAQEPPLEDQSAEEHSAEEQ